MQSGNISGPWTLVEGATSPMTIQADAHQQFFKVGSSLE
jgi:hypothetical protein